MVARSVFETLRAPRGWALAVLLAAGCSSGGDASLDPAPLGTAREDLTAINGDVQASQLGSANEAVSPSLAWIKSAPFSSGRMFAAYTQDGVAAVSESIDWSTASPTWTPHKSNDPALPWPVPFNYCTLFDCVDFPWSGYVSATSVMWTGIDDTAVVLALGGPAGHETDNVVAVSFTMSTMAVMVPTQAMILSIPTSTEDSGGGVFPDTPYGSMQYAPEMANAQAGTTALPGYAIWRNLAPSMSLARWWMTKFEVGVDGSISEILVPRGVSAIAQDKEGHASLMGWLDDGGAEVLTLGWSERRLNGVPNPGPSCPSNTLLDVRWWQSFSRDLGASWACTESAYSGECVGVNTLVDEDRLWRPCVGPSFGPPTAPGGNVNNDRPEQVVNRGGPMWNWYYVINRSKPTDPSKGMRVRVWRDTLTGSALLTSVYVSPDTLPNGGGAVGDSWGQSVAIVQGNSTVADPPSHRQPPVVALAWRTFAGSQISMAGTSSVDTGNVWTTSSAISTASWSSGDAPGLYTGTAGLQLCLGSTCPSGDPAQFPFIPFASVWPDNRNPGTENQIFGRAYFP